MTAKNVNTRDFLTKLFVAVLFLAVIWILYSKLFPQDSGSLRSGAVIVEVYYEALCPDSRSFILRQLYPTWEKLSDIVDIHFKPYGKASTTETSDGDYAFRCQHGPEECEGNMIHACAVKHIAKFPERIGFVKCLIDNYMDVALSAKKCSDQLNIDYSAIKTCAYGKEGRALHAMYGRDTEVLRPRASFIPAITLNGDQGSQKDILKNMLQEVCRQYKGPRPENCVAIL